MRDAVIFTPDDEPYLGRHPLHVFDVMIVETLGASARVSEWTRSGAARSDLQEAAVKSIPQAISLALAIRELLRQGYLFPAKVMLRSFVERVVTVMYLAENPEAVAEWQLGWRYKKRPSLAEMMNYFAEQWPKGEFPPKVGALMTKSLNSLTHGDPESADWNTITLNLGRLGFGVSKNLDDPDLCDEICGDMIPWLVVVVSMTVKIFPDAHPRLDDVAPGTTLQ